MRVVPATADSYNAFRPSATVTLAGCPASNSRYLGVFAILPESVGIIGLGAIGGSLAWRATQAGVRRVTGYSRSTGDVIEALKRGAITDAADSPQAAARGSAFVVLAAPPSATLELLDKAAGWLAPTFRVMYVQPLEGDGAEGLRIAWFERLGFQQASPLEMHGALLAELAISLE